MPTNATWVSLMGSAIELQDYMCAVRCVHAASVHYGLLHNVKTFILRSSQSSRVVLAHRLDVHPYGSEKLLHGDHFV